MKIYVWDQGYLGAYIIVAPSAQAAADKWNAQYPRGVLMYGRLLHASPQVFKEHDLDEIVSTDGDS